jgi:hypothetical protein
MYENDTTTPSDHTALEALSAQRIADLQAAWTRVLHEDTSPIDLEAPWTYVEANHRMNFTIWHEEDVARRDDIGADRVRDAKRVIDRGNQARNDAMEAIDQWISERIAPALPGAPLHSETPGMIIDRLSILALKLFHMREQAERDSADAGHRERCRQRAEVLRIQLGDLRVCLASLLSQLASGERAFRVYRQFKMYNDPTLNPQLYMREPGER